MARYEARNIKLFIDGEWWDAQEPLTYCGVWSDPVSDNLLDELTNTTVTFELRWYDPFTDLWKAIENWLWSSWMGRN